MGLDDLSCDICGMRYAAVEHYRLHVEEAHREDAGPLRPDRLPHTEPPEEPDYP